VARWLAGTLEREPMRSSDGFEAHRIVLGSLMSELEGLCRLVDEPVGPAADLRAAKMPREELRARQALEAERQAYHDHVSDVIAQGHAQDELERPISRGEESHVDEPATVDRPAEEAADARVAWL
jgi:hypothetical protein